MADPDLKQSTPTVQAFNPQLIIYEQRPESPDAEEATKLSDFCANESELAIGLGYDNVADLDTLSNSKLIKPYAEEWRDWL